MKLLSSLVFVCLLSACGAGDGTGLDENGEPIGNQLEPTPDPDPRELQPNLTSIQEHVLTPICSQCHAGNNAPLGLRMDDLDTSFANLINVDSVTNPLFKLINPGEKAEQSFLFLKIIGDPQAGNQMPLGQTPLDNDTIEVFRNWIENGAPIDVQQVVLAQSKVTLNPNTQQLSIDLRFSQNISASSLQAGDIQLLEASSFTQQSIYDSGIELNWMSNKHLNLSGFSLSPESKSLTIRLNQDNISSVLSQSGFWLDGDRDGIPGGEFIYEHQF